MSNALGMNPAIDSDSACGIDVFHHEIHLGHVFYFQGETSSLAAAGKYYVGFHTPAGKSVHLKPVQFSARANVGKYRLYKGGGYSSGTTKTPINRNEQSSNASEVTMAVGATAGTLGTAIVDQGTAGTGGAPSSARGGAGLSANDEIILALDTDYVLEIENVGTVTATVCDWGLLWYEKQTVG